MKQTAVEWLWNAIIHQKAPMYSEILEAAKQMEKQQIIDAYGQGTADEASEILDVTKDAEQYYNETYELDKNNK